MLCYYEILKTTAIQSKIRLIIYFQVQWHYGYPELKIALLHSAGQTRSYHQYTHFITVGTDRNTLEAPVIFKTLKSL